MVDFAQLTASLNQGFMKIIAAIAIILIGLVIGRFVGKLLQRILKEFEINNLLLKKGVRLPIEQIVSSVAKYLIYFAAVIIALNQVGLSNQIMYIILITVLVLLIAFVVLAIKDFLPNLLAGIFLLRRKHLKAGDKITVNNITGTIQEIDLIETKVTTKSKDTIIIPNAILNKNIVLKKK
jgi:small-conductance mechanosensitive channel